MLPTAGRRQQQHTVRKLLCCACWLSVRCTPLADAAMGGDWHMANLKKYISNEGQ